MIDQDKMRALAQFADRLRVEDTLCKSGCFTDEADAIYALLAELEAAAADKRPSVVLTYSTQGHRKPCGQTMGANGCGEFVILYYGDIDSAESQARTHILNMQGASYQFDWVSIIRSDDEAYYGPVMTAVEVAALAQRQGEGS